MSAIGGIVDLGGRGVDTLSLNRMRRALSLRAGGPISAFVNNRAGMLFVASFSVSEDANSQPVILERKGYPTVLCIDSDFLDASSVSERYLERGLDFLSSLGSDFAISLYDEERGMLVLSRDRKGRKPIFYRVCEDKIFFSSEPKGIFDAVDGPLRVDREALEFHLTSPMGIYRASTLYTDISEVLPGECVIFTRFGISKFFYLEGRDLPFKLKKGFSRVGGHVVSCYPAFDEEKLGEYLSEALIAFDYPQFDCFIPSVIELLDNCRQRKVRSIRFVDPTRQINARYATEREDRLGHLYGVRAVGTARSNGVQDDVTEHIESALMSRFFSLSESDISPLKSVFGDYKLLILRRILEQKTKKEDIEKKIRILGMLCQAVDWMQVRSIRLVEEYRERIV